MKIALIFKWIYSFSVDLKFNFTIFTFSRNHYNVRLINNKRTRAKKLIWKWLFGLSILIARRCCSILAVEGAANSVRSTIRTQSFNPFNRELELDIVFQHEVENRLNAFNRKTVAKTNHTQFSSRCCDVITWKPQQ